MGKMRKREKLVYGVGINDADYATQVNETVGCVDGKQKRRLVWMCPFYQAWVSMLARCYSEKFQARHPTYVGCTVVEDWLTFSNFKRWMQAQDWEGNQLDKDLLVHGNKVYDPEHCVFVSSMVNSFMIERTSARGEYPIGVHWHKRDHKFQARCSNPFTGKQEYLGLFTCPSEAHQAWLRKKREHAVQLAAVQTDSRVAEALVDRYGVGVYIELHG